MKFMIKKLTYFLSTRFVYPRIDIGFAALSVDIKIISHEFLIANSQILNVAKTLFLTAEKTLFSSIFTCLYAAA